MKTIAKYYSLFILAVIICLLASCKKDNVSPVPAPATTTAQVNPHDTMIKFTLYSNRTPYIWKREVKGVWVQDTIKTNNAVVYENWDSAQLGVGYWATMNTHGLTTDSLHIMAEYKGKTTQMSSLPHLSAAYVLEDNIKP